MGAGKSTIGRLLAAELARPVFTTVTTPSPRPLRGRYPVDF
ncbi:shikimate kinase [Vreelandella titanicae]